MSVISILMLSIAASAFFSGMEIAFVRGNKLKIELDKAKGKISGRIISKFHEKPSLFIAMLLLGNNVALVIYGMYMEESLTPPLESMLPVFLQQSQMLILILETLISTLIILIIAEFIPKALFRLNANGILKLFSIILFAIYWILMPFVFIFIKLSEFILKYFLRTKIDETKYVFSSSDLEEYVKEFSTENGINIKTESDLQIFQNAIDFKNIKIRECMVPRTEIDAIEINSSIEDLTALFKTTGHSKILLYEDTVDNIIGYVHAYDLFKLPKNINQIKRNISFLPETFLANRLLEKMIKEKISIAVILDEFGGTSGMITLEDLMEEIFGEIEDEFDLDTLIETQTDDGSYVFSARLEIDYLNEKYDLGFKESDEYETIGGLIINYNEDIPNKGEKIIIDGYEIKIIKASNSKIELIKMKKML
ncbi:MAG: hypothetical protein AUJ98_01510 [Bacteroidetes bacterium CG2_30_33_31]|nr:MAG: hypothetical protein AUJ98_01510 [Bacteroidetes bacterium CG2_30_33_31]